MNPTDDPRLTLTNFMARLNLFPNLFLMHLYTKNLKKLISYGLNQTIILAKISKKKCIVRNFCKHEDPDDF